MRFLDVHIARVEAEALGENDGRTVGALPSGYSAEICDTAGFVGSYSASFLRELVAVIFSFKF
jgi:hypothetical protein